MKTYKERTDSILQKAEVQRKKRKRIKLISILSSVAAVILAFNLVMFVPYTVGDVDISQYKSSEYYDVIKQLYGLTYSPRKTNNFKEWFGGGKSGAGAAVSDNLTSNPPMTGGDGNGGFGEVDYSFSEPLRNQTDGVTEGDYFKCSDTHMFYLGITPREYEVIESSPDGRSETIRITQHAYYTLRVYSIAGENSEPVAEYKIEREQDTQFSYHTVNGDFTVAGEMHLSEDFKTITVIAPSVIYNYYPSIGVNYTAVINIDVSDLSDIKETNRTYISGDYVSSRVTDGDMLVITKFIVRNNVDFNEPEQYVPHVGKRWQMKPLLAENIVCPSNASIAFYTIISSLNAEHEVTDAVALMSFSYDVYVAQNNIYATRSYTTTAYAHDEYDKRYVHSVSDICIVPYTDGVFGETVSVVVPGTVLNKYGIDEYNGILRAVTTVSYVDEEIYSFMLKVGYVNPENFGIMCMLYCYDLSTLDVVAQVTDFAPANESIMSARFDGDTAYVCTAATNTTHNYITDPVFVFDLSDLNNITYTATDTIPGYSLSLHSFAHDTLLGIGYGDSRDTKKIELYRQNENAFESVAKYEEDNVIFSTEFKAQLIDVENGIIGLGINPYPYYESTRYAIFRYDGYELKEIASVKMRTDGINYMRATVIDGYVYIFENDVKNSTVMSVVKIDGE